MRSKANTCQKGDDMIKDNRGTVGSVHRLQPVSKPNPWKCFMSGWHLDKKVPLALIAAIVAQAFLFGMWISDVQAKVTSNAVSVTQMEQYQRQTIDTLARIDERLKYQGQTLSSIEKKLP